MTTYQQSLDSEYVHHEAKGCKIKKFYRMERKRDDSSPVRIDYCLTHNKEISRNGIEWGKYSEVMELVRKQREAMGEPLHLASLMRALKQNT